MKITILDSDVRINHSAFIGKDIDGFSILIDDDGNIIKSEDFDDKVGHGTAIYYLINKFAPNSHLTFKICNAAVFPFNKEIHALARN